MDTSECGKLAAVVADERRVICDFLEWAGSQGILLAHHQHVAEYRNPQLTVVPEQADQIVLRYLDIDPVALERERRALLAQASNRQVSEDHQLSESRCAAGLTAGERGPHGRPHWHTDRCAPTDDPGIQSVTHLAAGDSWPAPFPNQRTRGQ